MGQAFRRLTPSENNLEANSLIWLDRLANTLQDSLDAQKHLRLLINDLNVFESTDLCKNHIQTLSKLDKVVLIVSGEFGQKIVREVQDCQQIISIYVYCADKTKNESWAKKFPKVRGVFVQLHELLKQIRSDQTKQQLNKDNEALTFTSFDPHVAKQKLTVGLNGQFVHCQLLINCLLQMESTAADMNELISLCTQEYQYDEEQLTLIRSFEKEYAHDTAVRWYTRDCFLYRMLNKALRSQDIHLLFLFRFLIRDLEKQLKKHQRFSHVTVYRGQLMLKEELDSLIRLKNQLISINSFLSTSLNRDLAYNFLLHQSSNLERVLFVIDADPPLPAIKPFADISALSYYPKEKEVLFMLGSIFRVGENTPSRNGVWTVRLTLCGDQDNDLKSILVRMKSHACKSEPDLIVLGSILQRMGKYNEAETYYRRGLSNLSSKDDQNISLYYYELGRLAEIQGKYELSLQLLFQSLEIDIKSLKLDDPNIANTYNIIGNVYQAQGDYKQALEFYDKSLIILRHAYGESNLHVAMCLNNIGAVYQKQGTYKEALGYYKDALVIREKHLPDNDPELGASHNNVGIVHRCLGYPDEALKHYKIALEIYKATLPSEHSDIAITLENMGIVYEEQRNWEKALSYYNQANIIYQSVFDLDHSSVIQIKQSVQRVSSKLK